MASEALTRDDRPPSTQAPKCHAGETRDTFLGALHTQGVTRFRVWAPEASKVEARIAAPLAESIVLERTRDGYFVGESRSARPGSLYKYVVDGEGPWPDPCSRFQPDGPHGPSTIVDDTSYAWSDQAWRGATMERQVIYEMHVGAFTQKGTFDAAVERLEFLRDLGVTMLELLPIVECPGRWNWGYDGVHLFAPSHNYGDRDALKRFVDRAHALGLAVILDVVYNHLGPDGNYLKCFSPHYFSRRHKTEWGEALNFDDEYCDGARDFVVNNAKYWLREFHVDGFRLDATQSIFDDSEPHILAQLVKECRDATQPRNIVFIAENEPQRGEHLLPPEHGGFGLDGMWNDDFHHSLRVAVTGSRDGYYYDYTGRAQELISAVKHGFLFQGQYYYWQKHRRGSPLRKSKRSACVHFIQNHDQVGNTGIGDRLHAFASPRRYRAATALLLLGPQTPLLFMGQEFLASNRFMFFADHKLDLAQLVHRGRREFVSQFTAYATRAIQDAVRDPSAEQTFMESKLNWEEALQNTTAVDLHRDLLRIRHADSVLANHEECVLDGATLSEHAFVLRWFSPDDDDRALVVNFEREHSLEPAAEPLLAPPLGKSWQVQWSSEDPRYGGLGVIAPVSDDGRWRIPSECAVLLQAKQ